MRLGTSRRYKPLDVGNGIVAGALTPGGRWLELGIAHPRHGRVVLSDMPPFDAAQRHDQAAVRAYRRARAAPDRVGFGLDILTGRASASLLEDALPLAVHRRDSLRIEVVSFAPPDRTGAVQLLRITASRDLRVAPVLTGERRLARAPYTQLTEGGPLPEAAAEAVERRDGAVIALEHPSFGAAAIVLPRPFTLAAGSAASCVVAIALAAERDDAIAEAESLAAEAESLLTSTLSARRALWASADLGRPARTVERRALAYGLDCAACSTDRDVTAVLADHVILPLVWTRDAYYVCRALLTLAPARGSELTERFVRWCFDVAERPGGWWPRASLASGQAKDRAFQLDQQLYPLLLLADHARLTGDDAFARRYESSRDAVLDALLARRTPFGLIATAETPADDPLEAPYHFSSHVLLWRVLRDLDPRRAAEVRQATLSHFASGDLFAYAVRGADGLGALRYHDANDLPSAFAPGWGFCHADDARWRATMSFAWSTANRGFIDGAFGGLGSVHTLHPWPLGDLQEIVVGRVLRDRARIARARARLRRVRTWDWMLPEAYDEHSGEIASRHWFAWPLALWALLERESRLLAP